MSVTDSSEPSCSVSDALGPEVVARLDEIKKRYPDPRSAVMPALYLAQEKLGYVTEEAILWVSEQVNLTPVRVRELVTFYTMYYSKPVGKYHVQVCRTLSCAVLGSKGLMETLKERFDVDPHQVTKDGMFSYEAVECLGSCGTAPMCQINDTYFENLTNEELKTILDKIEQEKPDLKLSTLTGKMGEGLKGYDKSAL